MSGIVRTGLPIEVPPIELPPIEGAPIALPRAQWAALEEAYATPPRAYHSLEHVREVLRHYALVDVGPGWRQPVEVYLAVLYHDAIHVAGAADNEACSSRLAREQIRHWLPDKGIDAGRVSSLIDMTARHGGISAAELALDPVPLDAAHFLDCDMAILGAEPAVFDAYDRAIAAEYRGALPAWVYRLNRRRFLKGLLGRERIFFSEFFHDRYDAQARANLRRAITEKR